jgi:hypothetical protein
MSPAWETYRYFLAFIGDSSKHDRYCSSAAEKDFSGSLVMRQRQVLLSCFPSVEKSRLLHPTTNSTKGPVRGQRLRGAAATLCSRLEMVPIVLEGQGKCDVSALADG